MATPTLARPPLRRRSLERTAMTPEQELELLIAEQQADDTYFIDRPSHIISLDAPAPHGEGAIGDLIGFDPWPAIDSMIDAGLDPLDYDLDSDELLVMLPLPATPPLADVSQHGTIYAYRRLRCRCVPCTAAQAKAVREYRASRKRAES